MSQGQFRVCGRFFFALRPVHATFNMSDQGFDLPAMAGGGLPPVDAIPTFLDLDNLDVDNILSESSTA